MQKEYRTEYPSDVNDEAWAFVAPHLSLCREDAAQQEHPLRAVFNGPRFIVKTGNQCRLMPSDLPPWPIVYQQMRRGMEARCFECMNTQEWRIYKSEGYGSIRPPIDGSLVNLSCPIVITTSRVIKF